MEKNEQEQDIIFINDGEKEIRCGILLTYHCDDNNKDYIVLYPLDDTNPDSDETDLYSFVYTVNEAGEGDLVPIETEEEYQMIDEVVSDYYNDLEEEYSSEN